MACRIPVATVPESEKMRMRFLLLSLLTITTGCGEKTPATPKEEAPRLPRITHFYGNATVVPKGGSVTLCYGTENVETLTLRPHEDGELRPSLNRCVAHTPVDDTTYTLKAKGPGGETTSMFSVRVGPPAAKERMIIQSFAIVGNTPVAPGGRTQLCYTADRVSALSVEPAEGGVLKGGRNQCFVVSPAKTTTYVLTARAPDGAEDRMQVTVPVQ